MRKRLNPVANPEENPENIQATLNISPRWFYSFGLTALQFWFTLTQAEKMLLKSTQCDLSSTSYSRQTDTPNISNKAKNTTKYFYIASNVFINLQLFIIACPFLPSLCISEGNACSQGCHILFVKATRSLLNTITTSLFPLTPISQSKFNTLRWNDTAV